MSLRRGFGFKIRRRGNQAVRRHALPFLRSSQFETLEERAMLSTLPAGFVESYVTGNVFPTSMDFAPDGRLFISDKYGSIKIFKNGALLPTPFFTTAVDTLSDRGMNSVVVDPNFATNHYVYAQYTAAVAVNPNTAGNGAPTRVVRLTASASNPDVADPNSEVVLFDNIDTPVGQHLGGFMHFGVDGMLYIGIGMGEDKDGSQDLAKITGKILRVDVHNYPNIIPADNPYVGVAGARPEIWALGFRNPFSGNIDSTTGRIFVNDVGSALWEEVDDIVKGANYGWPLAEGNSTNPAFTNPFYTYSHNGGGAAATGGVFYHGSNFPSHFDGHYFAGDVAQGVIRALDPADGNAEIFATNVGYITDLDVAPDGSLYYASVGGPYNGIFQISYVGGNTAQPTAIMDTDVTNGLAPLTVNFDGSRSVNPSGAPLSYDWNFGDGTTGTGATATHVYATNGKYAATLKVTDATPGGLTNQTFPVQITVGNREPIASISSPLATDTYQAGQTISFSGAATDPDDGALPLTAFQWRVLLGHNTHFHDFYGPVSGVTSGQFTIPTIGEVDPDQYYHIILTVTDSGGLQKVITRDIRPQLSHVTVTSNVAGATLLLDDQPQTGSVTFTGIVGMVRKLSAPSPMTVSGQTYYFDHWSDGGASTHSLATPGADTTLTAFYHLASTDYVATISATPPTQWRPGVTQTYNVTITNQGAVTWQAGGATPTKLAVYFDGTDDAAFFWSKEPFRFVLPNDVAPGQSVTVPVTLAGPAALGPLVLRHRMVTEFVTWFDQVFKTSINNGLLLADYPTNTPPNWLAGVAITFPVTITNRDQQTWLSTGANAVKLGLYFDASSDAVGAWTSAPTTFSLPRDLAPGESATFNVTMAAPSTAGAHVLRYRMLMGTATWSDQMLAVTVNSGSFAASYGSVTPLFFAPGETKTYSVSVTNTGTLAWLPSGTTATNLGLYWDASSDAVGAWTIEPTRFSLPKSVQPGETVNVTVAATAPATAGGHTLRYRMVTEYQTWFSQLLTATVAVGNYTGSYAGTPPTVWPLGSTQTYNVTLTNTGEAVWQNTGGNMIQLGAYFGLASDDPASAAAPPVLFNLPSAVSPGQSVTVPVTITAPTSIGSYILRTRLVMGGTSWFAQLMKTTVSQPALAAAYVASPPTTWMASATQNYQISITNVGTQTWNAIGTNAVHLGVYFGNSSDAVGAWPAEPKRFTLPVDVAPGQTVTFSVSIAAPATSGSYVLRNRLVKESVAWFDDQLKTSVTVSGYNATYAATVPTTWTPSATRTFSVTITNTGSTTWNATGTNPVHLGAYFGGTSDAVGAWTSEPKRINLPADLAPGKSVTVSVALAAPAAPGTYVLRLRMVKENVLWFTDMQKTTITNGTAATVTPPTVYRATTSSTPPTSVTNAQTLAYNLTLTNIGADTWKSTGTSRVRVVAYFVQGTTAVPTLSATTAYSAYLSSDVLKNGAVTVPISFKVPTTRGQYRLFIRLIGDDGSVSDFVQTTTVSVV